MDSTVKDDSHIRLKKLIDKAFSSPTLEVINSVRIAEAPQIPCKSSTNTNKIAVWTLLLTYFFSISVWISPEGPLKNALVYYARPLISATGIGQSWSVFAPEVRNTNYHETALIYFRDGSVKLYEFPRMEKLDYLKRFRREKFRKMFCDCMPWAPYTQFQPDFASFVARCNTNPTNEPVVVTLVHNWRSMPAPDPQHWVNRNDLPEHTNQTPLYVYYVQPEDLR
jgi:hypothetical protein